MLVPTLSLTYFTPLIFGLGSPVSSLGVHAAVQLLPLHLNTELLYTELASSSKSLQHIATTLRMEQLLNLTSIEF